MIKLYIQDGAPNPWCIAARALLDINAVKYELVHCEVGQCDDMLIKVSGQTSLPILVTDDHDVLVDRDDIINKYNQTLYWNSEVKYWVDLVAGENGLGWNRRLLLLHEILTNEDHYPLLVPVTKTLADRYKYSPASAALAGTKIKEIVTSIISRLSSHEFLHGSQMSVADVFVAVFSMLICRNESYPINEPIEGVFDVTDKCLKLDEITRSKVSLYQVKILNRINSYCQNSI